MDLTPEQRERVYLEEKARLEAVRTPLSRLVPRQRGIPSYIWFALAIGTVAFIFYAVILITGSETQSIAVNPQPATQAQVLKTGNEANDLMLALPEQKQAFALGKIVNDGCIGNRAFYMGISPGSDRQAFWSVACANGDSYAVGLKADAVGSTSIVPCAAMEAIADIRCFAKLEDRDHRAPRTEEQRKAAIDRLSPEMKEQLMNQLKENITKP